VKIFAYDRFEVLAYPASGVAQHGYRAKNVRSETLPPVDTVWVCLHRASSTTSLYC
jgi:hypothetical protein